MVSDMMVFALFAPIPPPGYDLHLVKSGNGQGAVAFVPPGIPGVNGCDSSCSEVTAGYLSTTPPAEIALTATTSPEDHSEFLGWGGGCTPTVNPAVCTATMDGDKTVEASFIKRKYLLTVGLDGSGGGAVLSATGDIDCAPHCSDAYDALTTVTLTATAVPDAIFTEWSSGDCSSNPTPDTCEVSMDGDQQVTATFVQQYELLTTKSGTGQGTVSSASAGIDCGNDCSQAYENGSTLFLTAEAAAGCRFVSWSGSCSGEDPLDCTVAMNSDHSVDALFEIIANTLSVSKTGVGSGRITSNPAGIDCGTDCTYNYLPGTEVQLSALSSDGSVFSSWGGACSGNDPNGCLVTLDDGKAVTAIFLPLYALSVTKIGPAGGFVTSTPSGINCGDDCQSRFPAGTTVGLNGGMSEDVLFSEWSGDCTGNDPNGCQIPMDGNKNVTAIFEEKPVLLSVFLEGDGNGSVTSTPGGIDCVSDCQESFAPGTWVTLKATPTDTSDKFIRWEGACSNLAGNCQIALDQSKEVTAIFGKIHHWLMTKKAGGGYGTVKSLPDGIDCGGKCSATYPVGTTITLSTTAELGSEFSSWSGDCSGEDPANCTVEISADQWVEANFTKNIYTLVVFKTGIGNGTISSSPAVIDCGNDCQETFDHGTQITLTATPNQDSVFRGWDGSCSGKSLCIITMDQEKQVSAIFDDYFPYIIFLPAMLKEKVR